jgi:hypothetical protein
MMSVQALILPIRRAGMYFHASDWPTLIDFYFVYEAPSPILTGLERLHDGVLRLVEVSRCVLVLGLVTAAHMAALHAQPQMHPEIADFEAVLTPVGARFHLVNVIQVRAPVVVGHIYHVLGLASAPMSIGL